MFFLLVDDEDRRTRREMEASIYSLLEDAHLALESEEYYKRLGLFEGYELAAESEEQSTRLGRENLQDE
jgi:hypothetical protein